MNVLKTIGRLVLGLLVIVLVAFFSLMVFTGWIKIWNVTLLAWFPLIFVDISIDKDEEQWKQYFETEERKGIQLIAKSPSKTMQDFQFEGIPRYVLLKADGKFQSVFGPNYFQLD